jgi:hypothetical protein
MNYKNVNNYALYWSLQEVNDFYQEWCLLGCYAVWLL